MTSRDFCYWMQGYFEIGEFDRTTGSLSPKQLECIKKHLAMVFYHEIDPSFEDKEELDKIHSSETKLKSEEFFDKAETLQRDFKSTFDPHKTRINC